MSKSKVLILGTIPPPIGGVSIHVLRLISGLKELGYDSYFINIRPGRASGKISFISYIYSITKILRFKTSVIHYQLNNWYELLFIFLIAVFKRNRIIATVHSFRLETLNLPKKVVIKLLSKTKVEFIAPSDTIRKLLLIKSIKYRNIHVINTFLKPSSEELNSELPIEIINFIDNKKNVIVGNASKLYLDSFGTDIYGLDMCIEACKDIKESNFIYCIPDVSNENYYNNCKTKILEYGIQDRFLIVTDNISLVSLFKYADIFVRPTSTDSFGVSVAEAIMLGIPAIASDVCERYDGAIIYKSQNQSDFNLKIQQCIKDPKEVKSIYLEKHTINSYIDLYDIQL